MLTSFIEMHKVLSSDDCGDRVDEETTANCVLETETLALESKRVGNKSDRPT